MEAIAQLIDTDALLAWLESPAGALLFIPLYAIWVTLLLPGIWASMLAGALYGPWLGSLLVFAGASLGAEAAFLLGRHWLRGWAQQRLSRFPKLLAIEKAVSREGFRLVLLTRLSPAFPFSLLNLAYGLSEVSLRDYNLGLIGIIPGTILFCALGALAGSAGHTHRAARPRSSRRRAPVLGLDVAVCSHAPRAAPRARRLEQSCWQDSARHPL